VRYLFWRLQCTAHMVRNTIFTWSELGAVLNWAWYVSGCFEDWDGSDPIECADSELGYTKDDME
jgi:hypothetical protein